MRPSAGKRLERVRRSRLPTERPGRRGAARSAGHGQGWGRAGAPRQQCRCSLEGKTCRAGPCTSPHPRCARTHTVMRTRISAHAPVFPPFTWSLISRESHAQTPPSLLPLHTLRVLVPPPCVRPHPKSPSELPALAARVPGAPASPGLEKGVRLRATAALPTQFSHSLERFKGKVETCQVRGQVQPYHARQGVVGFAGEPNNFPATPLCPLIFTAGPEWLMGTSVSLAQPPSAPPAMLTCLPVQPACACLFAGGDGHGARAFAVNLQIFGVGGGHTASPVVPAPSRHSLAAPTALAVPWSCQASCGPCGKGQRQLPGEDGGSWGPRYSSKVGPLHQGMPRTRCQAAV